MICFISFSLLFISFYLTSRTQIFPFFSTISFQIYRRKKFCNLHPSVLFVCVCVCVCFCPSINLSPSMVCLSVRQFLTLSQLLFLSLSLSRSCFLAYLSLSPYLFLSLSPESDELCTTLTDFLVTPRALLGKGVGLSLLDVPAIACCRSSRSFSLRAISLQQRVEKKRQFSRCNMKNEIVEAQRDSIIKWIQLDQIKLAFIKTQIY